MKASTTARSARAAAAMAQSLALAPGVMMMRMPLLALEAKDHNPWRVETVRATVEKMGAGVEGVMAAQLMLFQAALGFWPEVMSGRTPALLSGAAAERAMHAAMRPAAAQVKSNHRRLSAKA
jgi:hypothetical protein